MAVDNLLLGVASTANQEALAQQLAGALYTEQSIPALSAGQAAGTSTVLAANADRKALMIVPPANCALSIESGAAGGWPLFGGVPNTISGQECPLNALYLVGLAADAAVTIWEA
jgi:hypothetical protein